MFKKKKEKIITIEEKKEPKMVAVKVTNPLLGIKTWAYIIGAAILLIIGLWIIFDHTLGKQIAIGITGVAIIVLGLIRIIPVVKSTYSKKAKGVCALEITTYLVLGIFLFVVAIKIKKDGNDSFSMFMVENYKYFLGSAFYLKVLFYFINTSLLNEKTTRFEFWVHILVMTVAMIVFALDFNANSLAILIAILCLVASLVLGYDSGSGYYKYRKSIEKPENSKKNIEDETNDDDIVLPSDHDNNQNYVN